MSDIADALGITRRTVYRYFTSTEELFTAVAEVALGSFIAQVENITADMDIAGQLVEVVAYIMTSALAAVGAPVGERPFEYDQSLDAGPSGGCALPRLLQHTHIDWGAWGYGDRTIANSSSFCFALSSQWLAREGSVLRAVPGSTSRALALSILQSRECLRSYEELLSGRPLDVTVERIGAEHAGE